MTSAPAPATPVRPPRVHALGAGVACHLSFIASVAAMIGVMATGMQAGLGRLPGPWGWAADALLIVQFAFGHSWLLGRRGGGALKRLAPGGRGGVLLTTTYVTLAAWQVLALFLLWTPSGVVWWRARGALLWAILIADAGAWLLLLKAITDAGFALQTGLLGWRALWRGEPPRYPPMPVTGLFRWIRQPIYLAFALTTVAVPVWTPDQLVIAGTLGGYCLLGPLLKERRFRARYGEAFNSYRAATGYWLPRLRLRRPGAGRPA